METLDWIAIMLIFILAGGFSLLSSVGTFSSRLKRIEMILSSIPGADLNADGIGEEVKSKIASGKINEAIILYRTLHDSSLHEAELAVKNYVTRQG